METLHFEAESASVRTISPHELAETYFRHKKNQDRRDVNNIKKAFALLAECLPSADTSSLSALKLLEYQQFLVSKGYARNYCNKLVSFVRSVFYWGEIYELVPTKLAYSLRRVPPLRKGEAQENEPRQDVPKERLESVLPYLLPTSADMLRLQLLTGARSAV